MNNNYASTMYLTTTDLNTFENRIESITNEVQEKIFDNVSSPLKNIEIGDNLNGKTIYLNIPPAFYNTYDQIRFIDIVTTNKDNKIYLMYTRRDTAGEDVLLITSIQLQYHLHGDIVYKSYHLYYYYDDVDTGESFLETNKKAFKLPNDFGIVTSIDTNNSGYQYIKIYDDETIIPDYVKHVWANNEELSMQKIDNIEKGLLNIGKYYYKPDNWINVREWLKVSTINDMDSNMNIQNISYTDLNRWLSNLELINFNNLDILTIWNSDISQIYWNIENNVEWEDL